MAGERRRGLLWQSPMPMLNPNLMDMATTGPMDTGAGEGRRDLLSPMLWLNLNLMDTDMAPMATTGPMGTGAGERRKGLPSPWIWLWLLWLLQALWVLGLGKEEKV